MAPSAGFPEGTNGIRGQPLSTLGLAVDLWALVFGPAFDLPNPSLAGMGLVIETLWTNLLVREWFFFYGIIELINPPNMLGDSGGGAADDDDDDDGS